MANIDLNQYGITGVTEILHNPSYEVLFQEETRPDLEGYDRGQVTELGAVNVMTGIYTGLRCIQERQQARLPEGLGHL